METLDKPSTGGKFKKGKSGNPFGRPLGSRNKATLLAEQLLEGEGKELLGQVITLAKKGNIQALRLCIERLVPVRKERPIQLDLPPAQNIEEIAASSSSILAAVGEGRITPGEAQAVSQILSTHTRLLKAVDVQQRNKANEPYLRAQRERNERYHREMDMREKGLIPKR